MGHATTCGIRLARIVMETGVFSAQIGKSSCHPFGPVSFMIEERDFGLEYTMEIGEEQTN